MPAGGSGVRVVRPLPENLAPSGGGASGVLVALRQGGSPSLVVSRARSEMAHRQEAGRRLFGSALVVLQEPAHENRHTEQGREHDDAGHWGELARSEDERIKR